MPGVGLVIHWWFIDAIVYSNLWDPSGTGLECVTECVTDHDLVGLEVPEHRGPLPQPEQRSGFQRQVQPLSNQLTDHSFPQPLEWAAQLGQLVLILAQAQLEHCGS